MAGQCNAQSVNAGTKCFNSIQSTEQFRKCSQILFTGLSLSHGWISCFFCNAGCVSVQNFPTLVEIDQLKSFSVSTKGKFYEEKGKRQISNIFDHGTSSEVMNELTRLREIIISFIQNVNIYVNQSVIKFSHFNLFVIVSPY